MATAVRVRGFHNRADRWRELFWYAIASPDSEQEVGNTARASASSLPIDPVPSGHVPRETTLWLHVVVASHWGRFPREAIGNWYLYAMIH